MSALHLSAYEGDANVVRGRLELGEDPNARDEVWVKLMWIETPLLLFKSRPSPNVVRVLVCWVSSAT